MPERQTPENCTCGAALADRSRFCHMCGRPLVEDVIEMAPPPAATPSLTTAALASAKSIAALPVGFGNPVALRVAVLIALGIVLIEIIPGVNLLFAVWGVAGGWCAVLLYRRFTGCALDIRAGARLGSLTGVFNFVCLLVMSTMAIVFSGEDILKQLRSDPATAQAINNPVMLAGVFLIALVFLFAIVVGTCAAGGALGARYLSRHGANPQV
jgi:hypothetical protein